ncbi:dihydrodipicolinate reductase [Trebonia kvetii]|uniref:Dihydrodipicolinate reductase n=1 Tax=Trebonia kvetii TaxID=2480626 RepID=A0A6P2BUU8_9ACTN|nr:dihydrodipicolinate reductase [Trebonia kvetii]TVZ02477.1 dihydrodipicolinate reductase [Trebonia kvetii]
MTGLRVVQWATGNIGSRSLRQVIEHPALTLAGVYVTSPAKAGRDAGDLCGLPPTGVTATNDIAEILALGADCVLYMPAVCDLDQVCAILADGTNIVTTRGEFHHPGSMPPADRERVERACAEGGTSIHSTGSSPGFISEAVPLVLASIQRRLDGMAINEYADLASRNSPEMLFDLMGFGHSVAEFPPERFAFGAYSFGPSMRLVAEAVGLPLDSVTATGEVTVTPEKLTIAAGTLEAGTVAGQRTIVTGTHAGRPLMTFTATWYCTEHLEPAWTVPGWDGWKVHVDGDAPVDVDIRFDIPVERMGEMTPGYTANRPVNAIPYVCAAAPGIRTTVDLPQIIPVLA